MTFHLDSPTMAIPLSLTSGASILAWCAVAYVAITALYRLYLSPLAKIPGPRLAALTEWFECYYDVVLPAQYVFKIKELHAQYGPVVRIGPNDVSIADPDFVDQIYAPGPGHKRDKDYSKNKALGMDTSIAAALTHDLHRHRREALNPFFSPKRILRLDDELRSKATQVESLFSQARDSGEVLNLSDVYFGFCNDIVHQYCFGTNWDLLGNVELAGIRRGNVAAVLSTVKVMLHFSWIRDIMQMLPSSIGERTMPPGIRDLVEFQRKIRVEIDSILARKPSPEETPSIFTHLRDNPDLPAAEKSAQRLEDEASLITMAGTYSPMLSLQAVHYHLLARPEIMKKLRDELAANPSAITVSQLEQLPYLSAVAQETHRLTFGLTGRNARLCPEESLVYTEKANTGRAQTHVFPPGTSLSASTLLIHTDEALYPDPWCFDPERWLIKDQELLARRRRSMVSFGRGPRICIGMHLANAEMAVLIAAMARWDMELFETVEEDVSFCHDYNVLCPRLGTKGVRVKVLGRHR
ncbi:cytochrome P450 [Nemania sp. FL0031]|nr:cytochrome P450 [Nemania sp. FL0031]